jgi:RNA ligase (TIGR02306 family)
MERKLASIQTISKLEPIDGADSIEKATVLGWELVVKKGEFQEGDKAVYVEIDSVLPQDRPEFEFMKPRGFRVKTVRLRGQISQGILFPLSIIPFNDGVSVDVTEGTDVTTLLGITKYEPKVSVQLAGVVKGNFPHFLEKTDETRVQVLMRQLDLHKGQAAYVTEKLDGSSVTFYLRNGEFGVCSRNLDLKESEGNLYWKVARQLKIEDRLRVLGRNIAIQGELIGEGVQKNKYKLKGNTVRFFSVFDIDARKYADRDVFINTIEFLGFSTVPILELVEIQKDIPTLVKLATRNSLLNPDTLAEGIVIRTLKDHFSFKVINPEFLIKHNE